MALPSIKNSVGMAVTAVADSGQGTLTVGAALSGGYQTAATAYGADANIDIRVEEDNTWEVCRDSAYDHSELTVTRGTQEDGSSGPSTRVAFTTAAKVYVIDSAERVYHANLSSRGHIEGGELGYSSTTAITVAACKLDINGKIMTSAGATLTSGSTMLDIAGSTVTIGASKAYFVYAYNNSGTLAFRIVERTGSGEGADPTWDADLDYWKAPSTGANARRIGKFWTNASSQVIAFYVTNAGRFREFFTAESNFITLVSAGTQTSYTAVTLTPYVTADDVATKYNLVAVYASAYGYIAISINGSDAIAASNKVKGTDLTTNVITTDFIPNKGTLYYKTTDAGTTAYLRLAGYRCLV